MKKSGEPLSIRVGEGHLGLDAVSSFLKSEGSAVSIEKASLARMRENADFFREYAKGRVVYGFNTGFGPMARHILPESDWASLQYNLIRSHAVGMGDSMPDVFVRAIMLVRLNTLVKACSGIYPDAAHALCRFLNQGITPVIPRSGSVGASGDLVQLAHVALALIGDGRVSYRGRVSDTSDVLGQTGCESLVVRTRDGLALVNGTSAMAGIAAVLLIDARKVLSLCIGLSALLYEVSRASLEYVSPELNDLRLHEGQRDVASRLRRLLRGSKRVRKGPSAVSSGERQEVDMQEVQHLYSIRCVPQVLGPISETLSAASVLVEREINAVTDNPVIISGKGVFHGGNFHGDYVSLEMDKVKIALTKLSMLSERQVNYLMNPRLNGTLPPFLNLGTLGTNLGLQGLQFVATSSTAENQTLSNPMSVHSIPTNNDNQDVVSMGTNSALLAHDVLDNVFRVVAVESMAIVHAVRALEIQGQLSPSTRAFYDTLSETVSTGGDDALTGEDVSRMEKLVREASFDTIC